MTTAALGQALVLDSGLIRRRWRMVSLAWKIPLVRSSFGGAGLDFGIVRWWERLFKSGW
jgi:hypothetical protein